MKKPSKQAQEAMTLYENFETMIIRRDYKKSGTILLSLSQGFKITHN